MDLSFCQVLINSLLLTLTCGPSASCILGPASGWIVASIMISTVCAGNLPFISQKEKIIHLLNEGACVCVRFCPCYLLSVKILILLAS